VRRLRFRATALLVSLLALKLIHPFVPHGPRANQALSALIILVLLAGVYAVSSTRRSMVAGIALAIPAAVVLPRAYATSTGFASVWEPVTLLVFFAYVTAHVARSVLRPGRIDLDRMATAVNVYLLLALSWSLVYLILSMTDPGAFRGPGDLVWSDFIYLSFTTITTLGYGDVVPATSQARTLATFEALVGVFFVATLVARFASLYERADRNQDGDPGAG